MTPDNYIQTVTPPEHNSMEIVEDNSPLLLTTTKYI